MAMDIEAALVRAIAPPHLADAIVGDLHERRAKLAQALGDAEASAASRSDAMRSLVALLAYGVSRTLADNGVFAFVCAAVTCALCVGTIPLWNHLGMGGAVYHLLRLAVIGLVLGCIPRASTLSCAFLLALIGVCDWAMAAQDTSFLLVQDGIAMASMLALLRIGRTIRTSIISR